MPYDPNTPTNPDQPGYPQQGYPQQPGTPQPGTPQPGYGQPPQYPQPEYPQPQYPQPGYGQPGPPSQGMGYGQPGAPSQGMGYGQPGAPSQGMGYGQPGYPSQAMGYGGPPPGGGYPGGYPPQQPRRSRAPMIAGIIGGVLLLCIVGCVVALYVTGNGILGAASSINTVLSATETAQAQATPTVSETILYQDSMTDTPDGWPNDTHCAAKADGYHIGGGYVCYAPRSAGGPDVDVTVDVKPVKTGSNTVYAVVFRRTSQSNYYNFAITPDGQWAFYKVVNGKAAPISNFQSSAAIRTGAGESNELRVVAVETHFLFYVNGQQVGVEDDSTFTTGLVGLANLDDDTTTEIVFTNLTVAVPA